MAGTPQSAPENSVRPDAERVAVQSMPAPRKTILLGIALLVFFASAYVHQLPSRCPTPISRLDLLHALLHGTVNIDKYHQNTPDKSGYNGHFYSDKAPGTVVLALPAFISGALLLGAAGDDMDSEEGWLLTSWIACVGSLGIITALGARFMFAWLSRYVPPRPALVTTLALFLGAAPLPYATMMFSHAIVVALLAIALWALDREPETAGPGKGGPLQKASAWFHSNRWTLLAGLCCGWALASEYTSGLIVVALFLWLLVEARRSSTIKSPARVDSNLQPATSNLQLLVGRALPFCLASVPPLLLIPLYSWLCFHNPFILPYSLNVSFPEMKHGLYAIQWPDLETAFNLLFTPTRGLFFWTPFLVMAGAGYWYLIQLDRRKFWLMYAAPLLQIIVISGRIWDWPAGPTLGPRYLAPILPLMALPCALGVRRFPRLGGLLATYSILITTLATLTNASPASSYYNPLTEMHIPLLLEGKLSPNLAMMLGLPAWLSVAILYILFIAAIAWLWREASREQTPF